MRNTRKLKIQKIEENSNEVDLEIFGYLHSEMQRQNSANSHEYKNSYIYLEDFNNSLLKLYYNYIIELLHHLIDKHDLKYNFIIDNSNHLFNNFNGNKTIHLGVNFEHTLVKKNGRSVPINCPIGEVISDDNDYYFVRIDNYDNLKKMDYVFDYSIPNIYNISQCNVYNEFSKKCIYISPFIFDPNKIHFNNTRKNDVITTFININEPRRRRLYDVLNHADLKWINYDNENINSDAQRMNYENINNSDAQRMNYNINNSEAKQMNYNNINNCFEHDELKNLYLNTKIIINIHQTDHHHTFEELRVLPALQCGVIVISEESPLYYMVPYNEMIIWCKYNDIVNMTKNVLANYDFYYNKIFIEKGHILDTLNQKNIENISKILE